jgi:hypothetical protein
MNGFRTLVCVKKHPLAVDILKCADILSNVENDPANDNSVWEVMQAQSFRISWLLIPEANHPKMS